MLRKCVARPQNHCETFRSRANARCLKRCCFEKLVGKWEHGATSQRSRNSGCERASVRQRHCQPCQVQQFDSAVEQNKISTLWALDQILQPLLSLAHPVIISNFFCFLHSGAITPYSLKWKTAAEGFSSALKIHLNMREKFCSCRRGRLWHIAFFFIYFWQYIFIRCIFITDTLEGHIFMFNNSDWWHSCLLVVCCWTMTSLTLETSGIIKMWKIM